MRKTITLTIAAMLSTAGVGLATPVAARDHYRGGRHYRDNRYRYRRCDNGTGGTIIGAIAGGLAGHEIAGRRGDRTAGVIIGGAVGALAGRAIDRSDSRC